MAVDTAAKRFSALNVSSPWRGLSYFPTGTITAAERQAVAYLYSGIVSGLSAPVFTGTIPNISKVQNTGSFQYDLSTYFSGATSYSIAPVVEAGWSLNTSTALFTIDTDAVGVFGPYTVTATNAAGTADSNAFTVTVTAAPVVSAETPAGRGGRRYRNIYRIKVDGEAFEFSSYDAAVRFLDKAKKAAAELADRTLLEAIESHRESVEIPLPTFKEPEIVVSSRDLRSVVNETKKEISAIYAKAKRDAEIAMLLEVVSRDQYNDEIIWFM